MIHIFKDPKDLENIRKATQISTSILRELRDFTKIGITPNQINDFALELCNKNNVKPAFLGVQGHKNLFPGYICISVNEETLHTIPHSDRKLESGDIVKLDFGIIYNGLV